MTTILGIESSCDETAASVVRSDKTIQSNVIHSQRDHDIYGGVVPEIASRAHISYMTDVVEAALREAKCALADVDAIAVTAGPGLIGGVIVGVMTAKALASAANKPFLAVNHLEGHALSVRLTEDAPFPYLLLLVSGGHCQLLIVRGVGRYDVLGETLDDALGEAFDKTAKMLKLGYPGGPAVEAMARKGNPNALKLPIPLHRKGGCDFSFSGLKTAVRLAIVENTLPPTEGGIIADICASFQQAATLSVLERLEAAFAECEQRGIEPSCLVVAGGVAANGYIKTALMHVAHAHGTTLIAPPPVLCTDNAAMIAWAGLERFALGESDGLDFEPKARWPLTSI